MMAFAAWVGLTTLLILACAVFCGLQWFFNGVVFGREPDFDWYDLFVPTVMMAMIVWLPLSLGWWVTSIGG